MKSAAIAYLGTALAMLTLDSLWLSLTTDRLYRANIGALMRSEFSLMDGTCACKARPLQEAGEGGVINALDLAAYDLCEEVRAGKWDDAVNRTHNRQPAASAEIIEALRQKCPGHSKAEYEGAIARGVFNSR